MTLPTKQEVKEYYNKRYLEPLERPAKQYSQYLDLFHITEEKDRGRKILDIACGTGVLLEQAHKRGLQCYGIDISDMAVKIARQKAPGAQITIGDSERLPYKNNSFDFIYCVGSLEHFTNIPQSIREIKRVSKRNCRILISVPNDNYLLYLFSKEKGTEQREISELLLSVATWEALLRNNGIKVKRIKKDLNFFHQLKLFEDSTISGIMKRALTKIVGPVLPLKYTYQIIYLK